MLAVLWRTTEDSRFQLLGNLDDNQLMLDELKQERDELNRKIGELEKSLADTRTRLDFALSERDAKTSELETTREALAQLREQQAVDKVNIEQLNTLLIEAESARDKATAERDEARKALDKALEENETDDLKVELELTLSDLAARNEQLKIVRGERDSAISERDAAQAELKAANDTITEHDNELAGAQGQLESVNTELAEALAQQSRAHSVLTLEGLLQERSFPKASFYRANGTIELETGAWVFIPGDIGGVEATRAGEASVTYTVIPSSCIRELEGDWPGALALDCPATIEWTIESRYPHFLLNILPIENFVMQDNVEQSTQGE